MECESIDWLSGGWHYFFLKGVFYGSMHGGKESNHISCSLVNQIILHILSVQIIFYVLALKVLCSCGTLWSVYLVVWFVLVQVDWTYESKLLFQEICFTLRWVMFCKCTENVCVSVYNYMHERMHTHTHTHTHRGFQVYFIHIQHLIKILYSPSSSSQSNHNLANTYCLHNQCIRETSQICPHHGSYFGADIKYKGAHVERENVHKYIVEISF